MLTIKRLAGVTPEVNLKECISHMPLLSVNKVAHSGFETQRRRYYQKSKTGVSVAPQKGLISSNFWRECLRAMTFVILFNCVLLQEYLTNKWSERTLLVISGFHLSPFFRPCPIYPPRIALYSPLALLITQSHWSSFHLTESSEASAKKLEISTRPFLIRRQSR